MPIALIFKILKPNTVSYVSVFYKLYMILKQ